MSELAKDLGITRQALYKWLSGENQPDDASKMQFITNL
ncbi:helix-turn-helix domain-containing protein, partial [Klebsiella pneumoniae]